ncbi:hypothetical protein [Streptomyces adustus]
MPPEYRIRQQSPSGRGGCQLGDATQYWRLCDAALVVHPDELTAEDRIGSSLRIPFPLWNST